MYSVRAKRIAVLGTDCAIGKRTTSRMLTTELNDRGVRTEMVYTVLRQAGPVVAATTYQTVPLVAVVVGIVILGEPFGLGEFAGTAFILAGLALQLVAPAATCRPDAGPDRRSPASPADRALQPAVARS